MGTAPWKPRILLAEDDPDMRRLIAWVLQDSGCEVIEVENGVGLLSSLQAAMLGPFHDFFDAVVSDVSMPDLTALDVLEAMPTFSGTTPFILISAFTDARMRVAARALGAVELFDKPVDPDALRARLWAALRHEDDPTGPPALDA